MIQVTFVGAGFDIPARYGVRQTIGDTIGIGGIFRGQAHRDLLLWTFAR